MNKFTVTIDRERDEPMFDVMNNETNKRVLGVASHRDIACLFKTDDSNKNFLVWYNDEFIKVKDFREGFFLLQELRTLHEQD